MEESEGEQDAADGDVGRHADPGAGYAHAQPLERRSEYGELVKRQDVRQDDSHEQEPNKGNHHRNSGVASAAQGSGKRHHHNACGRAVRDQFQQRDAGFCQRGLVRLQKQVRRDFRAKVVDGTGADGKHGGKTHDYERRTRRHFRLSRPEELPNQGRRGHTKGV